ncbi:MAG: hypothetical protein P4N59_07740 [Negativicutes bacterium]|nr:hypothetical protein [Negativicutes bacterium]
MVVATVIPPVMATVVVAAGWQWLVPAVLNPRGHWYIGHGLVALVLRRVVVFVARTADHGGQYRTHCCPGDDWHYHIALVSGCRTRGNQATGQDQGLSHLRKHGVSSGDKCGFAMDV